MPQSYQMDIAGTLKEFDTTIYGLTDEEARKRLLRDGKNKIEDEDRISISQTILGQLASPIIGVMIACAVITLVLKAYIDFSVIAIVIVVNTIIGTLQERKAENTIYALRKLLCQNARVIRDGKETVIDAQEVVCGDIILLEAEDKIPADIRLIKCNGLSTQEATLTGESTPITKTTDKIGNATPVPEQSNMAFAGTMVTSGNARGIVVGTGAGTQIGKIAKLVQKTQHDPTPLQKELAVLGKRISFWVIMICVFIFSISYQSNDLMSSFLQAVALAVAAIPEGLPAVVTITLALGIKRMAKQHALIRRLPCAETLGAVSVICTDKTGTLTYNEMTVTKLYVDGEVVPITGTGYDPRGHIAKRNAHIDQLLIAGALNGNATLKFDGRWKITGDPTEGALIVAAKKAGFDINSLRQNLVRSSEIPFESKRKLMTCVFSSGKKQIAYTKGAIESVMPICTKIKVDGAEKNFTSLEKDKIIHQHTLLAKEGLRVLAIASKAGRGKPESDMTFLGLAAMMDTPREDVRQAIMMCKEAGIKVVMITGDHIETAKTIARELGIEGKAVLGSDLSHINLRVEAPNIGVYARVNPEDKLRIIEAYKSHGHIVAMTGDGVNDAPALKRADIGIAMGTGTSVAKEASAMVLTDDNFSSIVRAVQEGRKIYSNITKFVVYLLSSNMGDVFAIFIGALMGIPMVVIARQILWINLVTNLLPALALGMEHPEPNIMKMKPRRPTEGILTAKRWIAIMSIGLLIAAGAIFGYQNGSSAAESQTIAFTLLVLFQMANVLLMRSETCTNFELRINWSLIFAVVASIGLQYIAVQTWVGEYFGTVPLSFETWMICAILSVMLLSLGEVMKFLLHPTDITHRNV